MIKLDLDILKLFHQNMKLGKLPPLKKLDLTPLSFLTRKIILSSPPKSVDWSSEVKEWGMMKNDQLGDCTCASLGHIILQWTTYAGKPKLLTDNQIVDFYSKSCGYVPGNPSTDNGGVETTVLDYWKKNGIQGDFLSSYVSVNPYNIDEIKDAINWFGNVYTGIQLPLSAQNQQTWDVVSGNSKESVPGSWGGHSVPFVAYNEKTVTCVTWGGLKQMTWDFVKIYMDECYALLSKDFINQTGTTPKGLDWETLNNNLNII